MKGSIRGHAKKVDSLRVVWPDGSIEEYDGCESGMLVELVKGSGRPIDSNE